MVDSTLRHIISMFMSGKITAKEFAESYEYDYNFEDRHSDDNNDPRILETFNIVVLFTENPQDKSSYPFVTSDDIRHKVAQIWGLSCNDVT